MNLAQRLWELFGPAGAVLAILSVVSVYLSFRKCLSQFS